MVWDQGTYQLFENNFSEALRKGHLAIKLSGHKITGLFDLVRLKDSQKEWLLIKRKPGDKIPENKKNLSIKSGRTMEEITNFSVKKGDLWLSNVNLKGAIVGEMPHWVRPMLAKTAQKPFNDPNWLFEIKWDGYRAVAEIMAGNVKLYSRNLKIFNQKFPSLVKQLQQINLQAVLDGEIVALTQDGKPSFQELQNYEATDLQIVYMVFDLIYLNGYDLTQFPLWKRKEILKQIIPDKLADIKYTDHILESGVVFFEAAKQQGLEGIIAKGKNSIYLSGVRSTNWLKIKIVKEQDAIILGYTYPEGGRKYFGSLLLGEFKNANLTYIGNVGTGFSEVTLKSLLDRFSKLKTNEPPTNLKTKLTNAQ
jgi:bifunctional non-homologous end joining protein LigD